MNYACVTVITLRSGINGDACAIEYFGQLSASAAGRRSLAGNADELGKYAGVTGIREVRPRHSSGEADERGRATGRGAGGAKE